MSLFARRPQKREPATPAWVRRLFLDDERPQPNTPEGQEYFAAIYCAAGPNGERDLWLQHEAPLLTEWIAAHPGTRPAAWWRFTAPEGRRQVSGEPIERGALHDQLDEAGLPVALSYFEHGRVSFESQAACLRRLRLLAADELAAVPASALRPEAIPASEPEEVA